MKTKRNHKKRHIRVDRLVLVIMLAMSAIYGTMLAGYRLANAVVTIVSASSDEEASIEKFEVQEYIPEKAEVKIAEEEEGEKEEKIYLGEFLLTGYCSCEICSEGWGTMTATGTTCTAGRTIAVDPNVIPYGSIVEIDGHRYIAEDCGGMINENHIDVYCDTHEECFSEFCNGYHDVFLLNYPAPRDGDSWDQTLGVIITRLCPQFLR